MRALFERVMPPKTGLAVVVSKAGDYVEFRAEMDCVVGLSNCPLDVIAPCNAYHCTPVKAEVCGA